MDVDAADKAKENKRKGGSTYCCCGCGEEIVVGYHHKLPDNDAVAKAWIRSIRPSVEDDELTCIISSGNRQLTARHWLLEGDPRLKEKQVGGTVNKGRRWIPRGGGGTSSLSSSSSSSSGSGQWSVQGAVPTLGKAEWEREEDAVPSPSDMPKARGAATTADDLYGWFERMDPEFEALLSRADVRGLKALFKRAGDHILNGLDEKEEHEKELASLRAEVRRAVAATKGELAGVLEQLKQAEDEIERATAAEVAAMKQHLAGAAAGRSGGALTYECLHPITGDAHMKKRVSNYAFFPGYESLVAFLELLEVGGLLDSVILLQSAAGTGAVPRPGARQLSGRNAVFFVLFVLRTGIDVADAAPLFGIDESTGSRYFTSYLLFLQEWLSAEFPTPTKEQIIKATPQEFKNKMPGWDLQLIFDATEFRTEFPEDLMVYRTLWSAYKHWTTVKLLGAIYPTPGGFCAKTADPTAYAGSAGDVPCTLASPIMKLLEKQMASLADKGFTLHAQFAEKQHYLVIPMYAYNKQKSFTMEDASMSHTIGHLRIYIEEAFRRVREFKIFRKQVKLSQLDLIGKMYSVCALLTNYQTVLKHDKDDPYVSISEKLWGHE